MPTAKQSAASRAKYYSGKSLESEACSFGNAFAAAAPAFEPHRRIVNCCEDNDRRTPTPARGPHTPQPEQFKTTSTSSASFRRFANHRPRSPRSAANFVVNSGSAQPFAHGSRIPQPEQFKTTSTSSASFHQFENHRPQPARSPANLPCLSGLGPRTAHATLTIHNGFHILSFVPPELPRCSLLPGDYPALSSPRQEQPDYPLCYDKGTPLIDTVPDILARIVAKKREELSRAGAFATDQQELEAERHIAKRRDFRAALLANAPAIVAEVKKASPSKGVLAADFDPAQIAAAYQQGGAAAVSVLTDEAFFQGSLHDLEAARAAISLPVLRKDFTIARQQIVEAAAHGADAILLIAAILTEREIRDFREAAGQYRLAALVEVHNRRELDIAIAAGSDIIGVNNRDLTTFEVALETSLRLAEFIPTGALRISESGINDAHDIATLRAAGYAAFLVGEHLMKSGDPAGALRKLVAA